MSNSQSMAQALEVPKGRTTRGVVAENTQMRVLALLNMGLDELNRRKDAGKGDFAAKLADQLLEDPKAGMAAMLEWLGKVAPAEAAQAAGGIAFDIKALYLNATQTANGHAPGSRPEPMVVEHVERGASGVHEEASDW